MKLFVYAEVKNRGWEAIAFDLNDAPSDLTADNISLTAYLGARSVSRSVRSITPIHNGYHIVIDPIYYNGDFKLDINEANHITSFSKKDVDLGNIYIKDLETFEAKKEGDVIYRLYDPKANGPRPLLLFLHGGGECGSDNIVQMTGTLGALRLAEMYPELYVMAPQAPGNISEMLPDPSVIFKNTFYTTSIMPGSGWHREYISKVCDVIRKMIADGKVDPNKVFVTGLSMGGCGAIRALSVAGDLFAAAAPICPSMMPDTYNILSSLTDTKIWVSTAYVDHTFFRHKYIVDAIMKLKDAGNKNAYLTLFAPEEFEKYGFANPDLPLMEKFSENHNAWVLTYNNEYGIMDWLVSQHK
ncbi:MAG: phospholipase [Herbinix sp.]|nr:phospholipase [Herbinix sp.]